MEHMHKGVADCFLQKSAQVDRVQDQGKISDLYEGCMAQVPGLSWLVKYNHL